MDHRGDTPGTDDRYAVEQLVRPLRDRLHATGRSQADVARALHRHPSAISRALSGRRLPALDLIIAITVELGVDTDGTQRRWTRASGIRDAARRSTADGRPPPDLHDYPAFIAALRDLVTARGISHRHLTERDPSRSLRPSTVGAVLRGHRSASQAVVTAIVRACGVTDDHAVAAWVAAWWRLGHPHRQAQHQRRRDAFDRLRAAYRPPRRRS